jgi:hypothetical protein
MPRAPVTPWWPRSCSTSVSAPDPGRDHGVGPIGPAIRLSDGCSSRAGSMIGRHWRRRRSTTRDEPGAHGIDGRGSRSHEDAPAGRCGAGHGWPQQQQQHRPRPLVSRALRPSDGIRTPTASMSRGRRTTATLLPNGMVLVAAPASTASGSMSPTPRSSATRRPARDVDRSMTVHRAARRSCCCPPARCSSPAATTRHPAPSRPGVAPRCLCRAVRPGHRLWTATGDMHRPHALATATVLADGQVLVVGGRVGGHGVLWDESTPRRDRHRRMTRRPAWTETRQPAPRAQVAVGLPDAGS